MLCMSSLCSGHAMFLTSLPKISTANLNRQIASRLMMLHFPRPPLSRSCGHGSCYVPIVSGRGAEMGLGHPSCCFGRRHLRSTVLRGVVRHHGCWKGGESITKFRTHQKPTILASKPQGLLMFVPSFGWLKSSCLVIISTVLGSRFMSG